MISAYIFSVIGPKFVIVCINYSSLYRIMYSNDTDVQMITSSHDLVIFFLTVNAENILFTYHPISGVHLSYVSLGAGRF